MLEPVKSKVLRIAKKAVAAGLVHEKAGNFSVYDKGSNLVVITPSGIPREGMELSDLCIVDLDGKLVEGCHKPSSETPNRCIGDRPYSFCFCYRLCSSWKRN